MGSAYSSHTNLGKDSTSFDAGATGTIARWGDSFEVSMGNWKENNDHTEVWGVEYKTGQNKKHVCGFQLKAIRDNNNGSVESIHFGIGDSAADSETKFALKITRVARDSLSGGIIGIDSSSGAPIYFKRAEESCITETTIVSYGCSKRDGLFVLEMKKKVNSENAYMVSLAHYYATKDVGLSVTAKICRNKNGNGNGFGVELEGPIKHPSADLRKVIVKTCRTGIWSPSACSHCNIGSKAPSTGNNKTGVSNNSSSLKAHQSSHHQGGDKVDHVVKHAMFSSNVREQYNKGLINSSGYTNGSLNNSIIFMNCNF